MDWKYNTWYKEKTKIVTTWNYSMYLNLYDIVFIVTVNPYGVRTFQYNKNEFFPNDDINYEVTKQRQIQWLSRISLSGLFIGWKKQ